MDQLDQSSLNEEQTMPLPKPAQKEAAYENDAQESAQQYSDDVSEEELVPIDIATMTDNDEQPEREIDVSMEIDADARALADQETHMLPQSTNRKSQSQKRPVARNMAPIILPSSRRIRPVHEEGEVSPVRERVQKESSSPVNALSTHRFSRPRRVSTPLTNEKGRGVGIVGQVVILLVGLGLGCVMTIIGVLSLGGDSQPLLLSTSPTTGSIVTQIDSAYLTALAQKNLASAGLPGTISHVQVSLVQDGPITITGDDQFLLITNPFTIVLQPYVQSCEPRVHVLQAHLGLLNLTSFATTFESQINQQLQLKVTDLPSGFTYCAVGVHTTPQGISMVLSATPK